MKQSILFKTSLILAVLSSTAMAESLKGRIFEDTNKNGVYDKTIDLVLKNVNVAVTDAQGLVLNSKTNKYGVYTVSGISEGVATINIDETTLPGINPVQVFGINPSTKNVIAGKKNWSGKDGYTFNTLTGTVCGIVFMDGKLLSDLYHQEQAPNYNNIYNKSEGMKDFLVSILDSIGNEHNTTTDLNGQYCIPNISMGIATINIDNNGSVFNQGDSFLYESITNKIDVVHVNKVNTAAVQKVKLYNL